MMHQFLSRIILSLVFCTCITSIALAQKFKKIDKNYFVIDINAGLSYAEFNERSANWRPTFYSVFSLSLMGNHRMNARLDLDFGVGGTFYYLINKSPIDRYILDFASPYLISGIGYNFNQTKNKELYFKLNGIVQLGYNDTLSEEFENYTVVVRSESKYYYSIKTQFGLRKFGKQKRKSKSQKSAIEYGSYFRFSFQNLGIATFTDPIYTSIISPSGDVGGFYYKLLFSYGGGKVRRNAKIKEEKLNDSPPIIYNPRF